MSWYIYCRYIYLHLPQQKIIQYVVVNYTIPMETSYAGTKNQVFGLFHVTLCGHWVMFCSSQVCWDGGHFHFTIFFWKSNNIQIYANVQKYPYSTALFRLVIFHDPPDDAILLVFSKKRNWLKAKRMPHLGSEAQMALLPRIGLYKPWKKNLPFGDG